MPALDVAQSRPSIPLANAKMTISVVVHGRGSVIADAIDEALLAARQREDELHGRQRTFNAMIRNYHESQAALTAELARINASKDNWEAVMVDHIHQERERADAAERRNKEYEQRTQEYERKTEEMAERNKQFEKTIKANTAQTKALEKNIERKEDSHLMALAEINQQLNGFASTIQYVSSHSFFVTDC